MKTPSHKLFFSEILSKTLESGRTPELRAFPPTSIPQPEADSFQKHQVPHQLYICPFPPILCKTDPFLHILHSHQGSDPLTALQPPWSMAIITLLQPRDSQSEMKSLPERQPWELLSSFLCSSTLSQSCFAIINEATMPLK